MRFIFFLLLISVKGVINCQTWAWAKGGVSPLNKDDEGYAVCTDSKGNACITGGFISYQVAFGTNTVSNLGTSSAMFVAKYDAAGNNLWARSAGGTNGEEGFDISCDTSGNVFVAGYFTTGPTIAFGTYTLNSSGGPSYFLVKYSPTGIVQWAKTAVKGDAIATGVKQDRAGNSYLAGYFTSTVMVIGTNTVTSPNGGTFLVKYDKNGNLKWSKGFTGAYRCQSLTMDTLNNVYITGTFLASSCNFGTYTLTNAGVQDAYVAKIDSIGNVLWAKGIGGPSAEYVGEIRADQYNNIYVTGTFASSTLVMGANTLTLTGSGNSYMTKWDSNGNSIWSKSIPYNTQGLTVDTYSSGVIFAGLIATTSTIAIGSYTLSGSSGSDPIYLAHYDPNGNLYDATSLGSGGDDDFGIAIDKECNAYICSDFAMSPFPVGTTNLYLSGTGNEDIYIAKYQFSCAPTEIEKISLNGSYDLYPNPNSGSFTIYNRNIESVYLVLFNNLGQKVYEQKIGTGLSDIRVNELSKGLYQYTLIENYQTLKIGKIIID